MSQARMIAAIAAVIFGAVALLILLGGCSSPAKHVIAPKPPQPRYQSQYPSSEPARFTAGCENAGAPASACACAIRWWMQNVPYESYLADGNEASAGIMPADVIKVTKACAPH